jgi:hypothetical protein
MLGETPLDDRTRGPELARDGGHRRYERICDKHFELALSKSRFGIQKMLRTLREAAERDERNDCPLVRRAEAGVDRIVLILHALFDLDVVQQWGAFCRGHAKLTRHTTRKGKKKDKTEVVCS